ncbi:MAG: hypothetical protein K2X56_19240 [Mycobacterium pseudokansasii]|uniref:hypothetical protein n=1 Tax=Mycobacterium pseudokansasii TaxID=2341080 RepID=UPI0010A96E55|nr:hypothetical protein [Mycobacterium pseudokansasii]MBY0390158.1 hypothetical protein [Mycobacterium pseudokansasii]
MWATRRLCTMAVCRRGSPVVLGFGGGHVAGAKAGRETTGYHRGGGDLGCPRTQLPKSGSREAYNKLTNDIDNHNRNPPNSSDWNAVQIYNQEAWYYNTLKAQLERQLDAANAHYPPTKEATRADIPYWTQPAPQQPKQGPPKAGTGPQTIDEIPLQTDLGQIERKYYHAKDFGVTDPRGRAGFRRIRRSC